MYKLQAMELTVKFEEVEDRIIEIREQNVILDSEVATLYGVQTRDINKAVKNNPEKFPEGYIFELTKSELEDLRWKISTAKFAKTRAVPNAFTEKGLYMLATILRSKQAIEATFSIIETFSKIRELSRNVKQLSTVQDKTEQKNLMQKSGEVIAEILDDDLAVLGSEMKKLSRHSRAGGNPVVLNNRHFCLAGFPPARE